MMYSILSAAGGYITFLGIFIIVYYTERMSELEVINVNEAYRVHDILDKPWTCS
jgi:hypothetical protein